MEIVIFFHVRVGKWRRYVWRAMPVKVAAAAKCLCRYGGCGMEHVATHAGFGRGQRGEARARGGMYPTARGLRARLSAEEKGYVALPS